jgi:hypothetical protein
MEKLSDCHIWSTPSRVGEKPNEVSIALKLAENSAPSAREQTPGQPPMRTRLGAPTAESELVNSALILDQTPFRTCGIDGGDERDKDLRVAQGVHDDSRHRMRVDWALCCPPHRKTERLIFRAFARPPTTH